MNQLNFSMLEILVQSEDNSFRDDGFVQDIDEKSGEIYKERGSSPRPIEGDVKPSEYTPKGRIAEVIDEDSGKRVGCTYIIFYEHSDPITELHVRGYLETQVLHFIGELNLLQQKLHQSGLKIDLTKFPNYDECDQNDRELVAHIGGFYAMEKNGVDISALPIDMLCLGYRPAIRVYQNALMEKNK